MRAPSLRSCHRRRGLTLVEMLGVLAILLVLLTLVLALAPGLHERQQVTSGAALLQEWLLIGKRQALRDRLPRGVRLLPLPTVTQSPQPVTAGANRVVTPLALSGITDGLPWRIVPGMLVLVYDADPTDPSLLANLEAVHVRAVAGSSLHADFTRNHGPGFTIQALAYARDVLPIGQPDDFVVAPGIVRMAGTDATPNVNVRLLQVEAAALDAAVLERLPLNLPPSPLPTLRPPLLPPGSWPPAGTQLPGDFTGGSGFHFPDPRPLPTGPVGNPPGGRAPEAWPVQPGDYLEIGGGPLHRIRAVSYYTWPSSAIGGGPATPRQDPLPGSQPPRLEGNVLLLQSPFPHPLDYTKAYRILRSARPLDGAQPLQLPQNVVIDLTTNFTLAAVGAPLLPVDPATGWIDFLFAPSGGVVGLGAASDRVTLWVRDATLDPEQPGEQLLVTVQVRSGLIAVHPVNTADNYADPYLFTRDGRSSGF